MTVTLSLSINSVIVSDHIEEKLVAGAKKTITLMFLQAKMKYLLQISELWMCTWFLKNNVKNLAN